MTPLFHLEGFSYKPAAFVTTTFHVTTHHLLPTFLYILLKNIAQPPSSRPRLSPLSLCSFSLPSFYSYHLTFSYSFTTIGLICFFIFSRDHTWLLSQNSFFKKAHVVLSHFQEFSLSIADRPCSLLP